MNAYQKQDAYGHMKYLAHEKLGNVYDSLTGEYNFTALAEQTVWDLEFDDSILDDDTHEIWHLAIEIAQAFEKEGER